MGASLILEKLFNKSSFYSTACFSILASGPDVYCGPLMRNFSVGPGFCL